MKYNQSRSSVVYPRFYIKNSDRGPPGLHLFDGDKDLGFISYSTIVHIVEDAISTTKAEDLYQLGQSLRPLIDQVTALTQQPARSQNL